MNILVVNQKSRGEFLAHVKSRGFAQNLSVSSRIHVPGLKVSCQDVKLRCPEQNSVPSGRMQVEPVFILEGFRVP
jgi:hypothetical protein